MTHDQQRELCKRALEMWGQDAQIKMVIEECAELIVELAKLRRNNNGSNWHKIAYEVADVEILLDQLRNIIGDEEVDACKNVKLDRLRSRLDKHQQ